MQELRQARRAWATAQEQRSWKPASHQEESKVFGHRESRRGNAREGEASEMVFHTGEQNLNFRKVMLAKEGSRTEAGARAPTEKLKRQGNQLSACLLRHDKCDIKKHQDTQHIMDIRDPSTR